MQPITDAIEFFSKNELACKGTGIVKLDPRFAKALPEFRRAWGKSLTANSVCRTPEHNRKVGGNPNSFHMTENPKWPTFGTMAADIGWKGWSRDEQLKFARLAWKMGWAVGLHVSFCHIDRRRDLNLKDLPQSVFLYGEWDNRFGQSEITAA